MTSTLRGLEHIRCSERAPKGIARSVAIVLGIALCFNMVSAASATNDPNKRLTSKQYAQGQLTNDLYKCLSVLYGKESAWNWKANSGSHWGIPQGRSEYLRDATAEQQVMWGLKYIDNRYGSPCKAWDFFQKNNYH